MLSWPHSGFHVHHSVFVPEGDTDFDMRLARYCARNPVALDRMEYTRESKRVSYRSDKIEGPTAGTEKLDPLAAIVTPTRGCVAPRPNRALLLTDADDFVGVRQRERILFESFATPPRAPTTERHD